ncbi:MAG: acyl-CoA dehydrogenase family protein [Acidobacteriota bacterium]
MVYRVDLQDIRFQIFDWLQLGDLLDAPEFGEWDRENLEMVLKEATELAVRELAPINADGDRVGVTWKNGSVAVPESVHGAWKLFREGGWLGLSGAPEFGGLGLPATLGSAINEVFAGANLSFSLVTLLTRGASELIEHYGDEAMQAKFCERMMTGEWTGTMCLTEPQAGSDVGASTTRAEKLEDGTYSIAGEKIFITSGEHDLADNIVHAVLARTPDAPRGSRGLSLFIVPKRWVEDDGSLGADNDVYCAGVEHKLGIHASPTCSMLFGREGRCRGYLLGEEGQGLRLMFDMMNAARIEVGIEGVAVASASYFAARDYALERQQMRHWDRTSPHKGAVPILEHPDVRRLLFTSYSYIQAMRALLLRTSFYLDKAKVSEGEEKKRYSALVALLTPVCKAWPTDWGFRITEWTLQVFGGYGYTRDYPAEQYLRDAKIASLYEGTNGIQALDFVGRKLPMAGGAPMRALLGEMRETAGRLREHGTLSGAAEQLEEGLNRFEQILREVPQQDDAQLLMSLNAVPVADLAGAVLGGGLLLQQAELADQRLREALDAKGLKTGDTAARELIADSDALSFLHNKVQSAIHFCYRAVPVAAAQSSAVMGAETAAMEAVLERT